LGGRFGLGPLRLAEIEYLRRDVCELRSVDQLHVDLSRRYDFARILKVAGNDLLPDQWIIQPLFARALFYEGITRIGVARAGPLRGGEPLFATAIAITIFHEQPGWLVFLGTILIVVSLWLISGKQQGDTKWRLIDTIFPISAGLISAISQSLRKQALKIIPDPFVAVAVVTTVSFILLLGFVLITKERISYACRAKGLCSIFVRP